MNYRNVVVQWHSYKDAKDAYVLVSEAQGQKLNRDLIHRWINVMAVVMAPIASHTSEYLWRNVLGNAKSVFFETYPAVEDVDRTPRVARIYVF